VALTGVAAAGLLGDVVGGQPETGDVAYGYVGSISASSRTVALTGVSANSRVGDIRVFYWTLIDDSETPNWALVNDSETPNWQNVNNSQTPDWENVEMTV
jgi:hypothetical protein